LAAKPLVYVHGAGVQKRPKELKEECDRFVFGRVMPNTRLAHYADVRWPPAGAQGALAGSGAGAVDRRSRDRTVRSATKPEKTARAAAAEIVAARLAPGTTGELTAAAAATRAGRARPATVTADAAAAQELTEQLFKRADRVAARSAAPQELAAVGFPDPIFRFIVGAFASDVVDYLFGGFAEAMRAPVRAALLTNPRPGIVIAHSLGTIITYDVLSEAAFANLDVPLLITLGCPLGIENVQKRLRNGKGRPNPIPPAARAWTNFGDRFDPVALERTLRDEFSPTTFVRDESVNSPARNNHDLTGYLSIPLVRSAIVAAVGQG
jgi:hypothetical protein